jgi:HPt (histidine-containing phosphotransfer) domain-containing protein
VYLKVLKIFLTDADDYLNYADARELDDSESALGELRARTHAIKSALGGIGATALQAEALFLETSAKEGDAGPVKDGRLAAFEENLTVLKEHIAAALASLTKSGRSFLGPGDTGYSEFAPVTSAPGDAGVLLAKQVIPASGGVTPGGDGVGARARDGAMALGETCPGVPGGDGSDALGRVGSKAPGRNGEASTGGDTTGSIVVDGAGSTGGDGTGFAGGDGAGSTGGDGTGYAGGDGAGSTGGDGTGFAGGDGAGSTGGDGAGPGNVTVTSAEEDGQLTTDSQGVPPMDPGLEVPMSSGISPQDLVALRSAVQDGRLGDADRLIDRLAETNGGSDGDILDRISDLILVSDYQGAIRLLDEVSNTINVK